MMWWFCALFLVVVAATALPNLVASQAVKSLPGFHGDLPFKLETGYVGVDEGEDVQLFYYFTESERSPEEDPLMLWLTGGPGCSSLSGLAYQIGPLFFDYENSKGALPTLILNSYSWTKFASILFLDEPVGTGFSYSRRGNYQANDTLSAQHTYNFLRKWLIDHPKFLKNPLYIAGDSYSGLVVPLIVQEILNGIEIEHKPQMNLKGYVLGNAATDAYIERNSRVKFAHGLSLIPDKLYQSAKINCKDEFVNVDGKSSECLKDLQLINKCVENINEEHILEPKCTKLFLDMTTHKQNRGLLEQTPSNFLGSSCQIPEKLCRNYYYEYANIWANDKNVQQALHVREGTKDKWVRCNRTLPYSYNKQPTVLHYHQNFTKLNLRVLIYSGDHDYVVPFTSTEAWIESLNLPIDTDWRPWFVDDQVAGYATVYSDLKNMYWLTFATVKGAGHVATLYKPQECFAMANRWFASEPL